MDITNLKTSIAIEMVLQMYIYDKLLGITKRFLYHIEFVKTWFDSIGIFASMCCLFNVAVAGLAVGVWNCGATIATRVPYIDWCSTIALTRLLAFAYFTLPYSIRFVGYSVGHNG